MRFPIPFLLLLLHLNLHTDCVFSQNSNTDFATFFSEDSIRAYLTVLTSDSLAGRETGKPGQKKSAAYLSSKYSSWNIPVQLQKHALSIKANSGKNLAINEKYFVFYQDFFYVGPKKDSLFIFNTILLAGFGISTSSYDDFKGESISQKNILVRWKKPEWKKKRHSQTFLPQQAHSLSDFVRTISAQSPATIFIVVDSIPETIHQIENDRILSDQLAASSIPIVFINSNTAENLIPHDRKKLYDDYIISIERKIKPKPFSKRTEGNLKLLHDTKGLIGENVLAIIEGKAKKDEFVVVSSHYDHLGIRDSLIYYGADDNASGTSAVLELARIFQTAKNNGHGPERSILIMNVSGEEKGLLGSSFYVKHPIIPLEKTVANLNIDMIGRIDDKHDSLKVRDYVYLIGADRLSKELAEINFKANSDFTKLELDSTFDNDNDPNRYYQRSDHYNFAKNNVPVIFYFNGTHADYHKPTDTPDKIDFPLLIKRAQLVFLTTWELVNRPDRIKLNK